MPTSPLLVPSVAIVLAGGRGTRLGSITDQLPKPLIEVAGQPFIFHVLDHLAACGIRKVVLATGYLASEFEHRVGARRGMLDIVYSPESKSLGTGGAVAQAIAGLSEASVYVVNGDTFFPIDLSRLSFIHQSSSARLTMALRQVPDVSRFGHVTCTRDRVQAMHEKGATGPGLINGGVYLLQRSAFLSDAPGEVFSLERDLLPAWIASGAVAGMQSNAYMIDIGVPADLERAQRELAPHR